MVNISGNKVVQKTVDKFCLAKRFFINIGMCTFRIRSLEAAILQAKV